MVLNGSAAVRRPSRRKLRGALYDTVVRAAVPGDVVFFISELRDDRSLSWFSRIYRRWLGFVSEDTTMWHTAIYAGPVKETHGRQVRPHIVHARRGGVVEEHLPPGYFTSTPAAEPGGGARARVEILHHPGLDPEQRHAIVAYCRAQLGKPFADPGWRYDLPTYAFGLPSRRWDSAVLSCHGLAYGAYARVGVAFPHHLESAPFWNLAHWLGHPLGHPAGQVDLDRLYLRDHHLYRDPRFRSVLAIYDTPETGDLTAVEDPGKYAWSPALRDAYAPRPGHGATLIARIT